MTSSMASQPCSATSHAFKPNICAAAGMSISGATGTRSGFSSRTAVMNRSSDVIVSSATLRSSFE
jgi:hypothetical protein